MAYEDLNPGSYEASLTDWSLQMVEKLKQPKVVLNFEFMDNEKPVKMRFEQLLFKKDGDISKKAMDTLNTCGFNCAKIEELNTNPSALNTAIKYSIDIEKDERGYWKVAWVNIPGGKAVDKVEARKSLAGFDFSKINGALAMSKPVPAKKVIKNHAPGADDNSEIPF